MILMFLLDLAVIFLVGYLLWRYVTVPIAGVIRRRIERTSAQGPKIIREATTAQRNAKARREAQAIDRATERISGRKTDGN